MIHMRLGQFGTGWKNRWFVAVTAYCCRRRWMGRKKGLSQFLTTSKGWTDDVSFNASLALLEEGSTLFGFDVGGGCRRNFGMVPSLCINSISSGA
eukprot:scaffold1869_cov122-Cylindrotheca_fusiformis.AAC.16